MKDSQIECIWKATSFAASATLIEVMVEPKGHVDPEQVSMDEQMKSTTTEKDFAVSQSMYQTQDNKS